MSITKQGDTYTGKCELTVDGSVCGEVIEGKTEQETVEKMQAHYASHAMRMVEPTNDTSE